MDNEIDAAMNPQEASVFFVDDEPGVRNAVQRAMESEGLHVIAFACAEDCLVAMSRQACDVLITDVKMQGMDGVSLLHEVKRRFPWLPTIIVTGYGDVPLAVAAIKAGAAEFIEKPLDRQELLSAVYKALEGARPIEPPLSEPLSDAELEVLQSVLDGRTSREIAGRVNRSLRTIEAHRHSIMRKLGVKNIAQLVQRANALGLGKGAKADSLDEVAQRDHTETAEPAEGQSRPGET